MMPFVRSSLADTTPSLGLLRWPSANVYLMPPAITARYWRIASVVRSGGVLEISELQFFVSGTRQTDATLSTSYTPEGGLPISNINDDSTGSTRCFWTAGQWGNSDFWIKATFPTDRAISSIRFGSFDTAGRLPTSCVVQYSANDVDWTTLYTITGIGEPSQFGYTPQLS